jgi:hypothetical protein
MRRFLAYGIVGLGVEVVFTSVARALKSRDLRLQGRTYLWMLPIYGAGGLFLERLHARLARRGLPPPVRALAATGVIYAIEYGTGSLLRGAVGECPWRYERGVTLRGYVRLDYAPYWYAAALLFELLQREIGKLDRPRRTLDRRGVRNEARPDGTPESLAISGRGGDAGVGEHQPPPDRRGSLRRRSDRRAAARAAPRRDPDAPCVPAVRPAPGETASA